ncbi:MAG TPA: biotin--[acetyl-CoA-carboxylase] ligase [Aciduliprofundum sp.]|nr:biotin--[acetyl-CoA-carboxylase] ligase [Aciduliprofundum sp.]
MDVAWGLAPGPAVVAALTQSAGRGRTGPWHSPPGGAYFSIVYPTNSPREAVPRAAVCTCKYLEGLGLKPRIRWPNDILVGEGKIAGILAESRTSRGSVVNVGVGLNVRGRISEMVEGAVSLQELGVDVDPLGAILRVPLCVLRGSFNVYEEFGRRLAYLGEEVEISGVRGEFLGIDREFRALLRVGGRATAFLEGRMRKVK